MSAENLSSSSRQALDPQQWSWSSWVQRAKSATSTTLTSVKRDFEEFGSAFAEQTSCALDVAKSGSRSTTSWAKSLMNGINDLLNFEDDATAVRPNESNTKSASSPPHPPPTSTNRNGPKTYKAYLRDIQSDTSTYCNEPTGAPDLFEDWLDHFNLADKKFEIFELLRYNRVVRKMFVKLVPEQVTALAFWQRYFYKLHQLNLDRAEHRRLTKIKKEQAQKAEFNESFIESEEEKRPDNNNNNSNKSNLNWKSKSTSELTTLTNASIFPNGQRLFRSRFRKSPSLDIEIKEAELAALGLLRNNRCYAVDDIDVFGPCFDSAEDHTIYCRKLCQSHDEHVEMDD